MSLNEIEDDEEGIYDFEYEDDATELEDLEQEDRFRGIESLGIEGDDEQEIEREAIELSRIDPVIFSSYVLEWPMQPIHKEMHDLLSNHDRLIIWAPIEHGKTSTVSIARILWELGRDPEIRTASISDTEDQATKSLAVVKQHILSNPRLHAVFPKLRPETRRGRYKIWHTNQIIVEREAMDTKDYSVQAIGSGGALLGARLDLAQLDDILNMENTSTPMQRKKILSWIDSTVESRSTMGGRIWFTGTGWHKEDAMYQLAKRPGWHSKRFDGRREGLWPQVVSVGGKLYGWPEWRIEQKRMRTTPFEFARQFGCVHASEASETFNLKAIEDCFDASLEYDPIPLSGDTFYVGVDLNVKKGESRHETCFFIGKPVGAERHVQRVIAGNMSLAEIATWFLYIEARYHPVLFLVENNQAQDYIVQLWHPDTFRAIFESAGGTVSMESLQSLPRVEGFTTGRNKVDPQLGIRGMTIEFEQRRWKIPDHPETRKWAEELADFIPEEHAGDRLMASWLFSTAATRYRPRRMMSRSVGARR